MSKSKYLHTSSAKCRDCYRCVRVCPVKAISIKDGQAQIDPARCILCGTCIQECPQKAKSYRNDIAKVEDLLSTRKVIASVAPSFAGEYGAQAKFIPSVLRRLGFFKVEETSVGAEKVTNFLGNQIRKGNIDSGIGSACPAIVNYIEKYKPELIELILPVVSPMIAHAKLIKSKFKDVAVVFIGPCIAKKAEAEKDCNSGYVDAVLTYNEFNEWLESKNITLENCIESDFDAIVHNHKAKLYAMPGGMLKTLNRDNDDNLSKVLHTNGASNSKQLLDAIGHCEDMEILEPLFCLGGCINGPGTNHETNLFKKRNDLIRYSQKKDITPKYSYNNKEIDYSCEFKADKFDFIMPTEKQIFEIYNKTGKLNPERRLDCGACGYNSCRDMAIAMINNMAESEMCLPYMRLLAHNRSDKIMESSPNGLVILNDKLRIEAINSSFENFFNCISSSVVGRHITNVIDTNIYELVQKSGIRNKSMIKIKGREFHQIIYKLEQENQLIGVYVDLNSVKLTEEKIDFLRKTTAQNAQKLLNHQIEMAQKLTKFLGENTAKSEILLEKLMLDDDE